MIEDLEVRSRLVRAAEQVRVDADHGLDRFHDIRPRRDTMRRRATAVAVLTLAAAALVLAWSALPLGAERSRPGASGPVATSGPAGSIAYTVFSGDVSTAALAVADAETGSTRAMDSQGVSALPVLSPDGTLVAYGAGPDFEHTDLTVAGADGTGARDLGVEIRGVLSWSPDGTRIAYLRRDPPGSGHDVVAVIAADGSDDHVVLPGLAWQSVSWSPDGSTLLVVGHPMSADNIAGPDGWDLYTVRADGSHLVRLTESPEWEHLAAWSPDGASIAFSRSDRSSDDADYGSDVWIANADGTNARQLTDWRGYDGYPVWSPDGRWIAFASDRGATEEERAAFRRGDAFSGISIFMMRPDGTDVREIVAAGVNEALIPGSWGG